MAVKYTLESDVDDYVKATLNGLGLKKLQDYNEKSSMSDYMKESLKGSAKTQNKTNFGIPDFTSEKYKIPVVIENKLSNSKHEAISNTGIKMDDASVKNYAVNGAIYYAKNMIASKKYGEVVAIGISGESEEEIKISVYYVFSATIPPKKMMKYTNLYFLQNEKSFSAFLDDAKITEEERHKIIIRTRADILRQAKKLNKLMNNCNIGTEQRVVYVSGMLLSMQDVVDEEGRVIDVGLTPEDLKGIQTPQKRDSILIINHLEEYLGQKKIKPEKKEIMIEQFKNSISLDSGRDATTKVDKLVGELLSAKSSITKQVFAFLYHYVYLEIDLTQGALDIMAEMYSTFLKYALSDGASLGKVLTPPYITNLMARILDINKDSKVMDLATGSAAFLVAAMDLMITDANNKLGKNTTIANDAIKEIKEKQLLGVEVDAKMYTLAASNMILRGDGSSNIRKADTFTTPPELFANFAANKLLLNPPFSYEDFGLPFFEFGLDHMEPGGIGAVIVQDSAGSGKAIATTKRILSKHTMIASIKMPADLFVPNAIVQTSIYVFKSGTPHNFDYDIVKFIDFRNDGYKRTERCIKEIDHPTERYQDLYLMFKLGKNCVNNKNFHSELWDIEHTYAEGTITEDGNDWNADRHIEVATVPKESDYAHSMKEFFSWNLSEKMEIAELSIKQSMQKPYAFANVKASKVFTIKNATPSYDKGDLEGYEDGDETYDYITRTSENRGICDITGFISESGKQPAGSFSLGLMQKIFFYRQREWYAGQFVKIIECINDVPEAAKIYLQTVLNGLTQKLSPYLVRDIERVFLDSDLLLPIKEDGTIDYDWMAEYTNTGERKLKSILKEWIELED